MRAPPKSPTTRSPGPARPLPPRGPGNPLPQRNTLRQQGALIQIFEPVPTYQQRQILTDAHGPGCGDLRQGSVARANYRDIRLQKCGKQAEGAPRYGVSLARRDGRSHQSRKNQASYPLMRCGHGACSKGGPAVAGDWSGKDRWPPVPFKGRAPTGIGHRDSVEARFDRRFHPNPVLLPMFEPK